MLLRKYKIELKIRTRVEQRQSLRLWFKHKPKRNSGCITAFNHRKWIRNWPQIIQNLIALQCLAAFMLNGVPISVSVFVCVCTCASVINLFWQMTLQSNISNHNFIIFFFHSFFLSFFVLFFVFSLFPRPVLNARSKCV